jgi:hypothetical protein
MIRFLSGAVVGVLLAAHCGCSPASEGAGHVPDAATEAANGSPAGGDAGGDIGSDAAETADGATQGHAFDACEDGGAWTYDGIVGRCEAFPQPSCSPPCGSGEECILSVGGEVDAASYGSCQPIPPGCVVCECLIGWCGAPSGSVSYCGVQNGQLTVMCYGS